MKALPLLLGVGEIERGTRKLVVDVNLSAQHAIPRHSLCEQRFEVRLERAYVTSEQGCTPGYFGRFGTSNSVPDTVPQPVIKSALRVFSIPSHRLSCNLCPVILLIFAILNRLPGASFCGAFVAAGLRPFAIFGPIIVRIFQPRSFVLNGRAGYAVGTQSVLAARSLPELKDEFRLFAERADLERDFLHSPAVTRNLARIPTLS